MYKEGDKKKQEALRYFKIWLTRFYVIGGLLGLCIILIGPFLLENGIYDYMEMWGYFLVFSSVFLYVSTLFEDQAIFLGSTFGFFGIYFGNFLGIMGSYESKEIGVNFELVISGVVIQFVSLLLLFSLITVNLTKIIRKSKFEVKENTPHKLMFDFLGFTAIITAYFLFYPGFEINTGLINILVAGSMVCQLLKGMLRSGRKKAEEQNT